MCASKSGGGVTILSVIPPNEFQHWIGVGDIMSDEARERIEIHFEVFAKWMRDRQNVNPELVIRQGDVVPEIMRHVQEDKDIAVLVLGAGTSSEGPGPLVSKITRSSGSLAIPITIVPGQLTKDQARCADLVKPSEYEGRLTLMAEASLRPPPDPMLRL